MNVVKKLTLRHLSENKGRTIITLIGICISVAMITAVFTAMASFLSFFGKAALFQDGDWHFEATDVSDDTINKTLADDRVESVMRIKPSYDFVFEINGGNSKTDYESIALCDKAYLEHMIPTSIEGSLPSAPGEAAVSGDYIKRHMLEWKAGDKVTLPIVHFESDGNDTDSYSFVKTGERSFTITAVLDYNLPTLDYPILILGSNEEMHSGVITALFKLSNPNSSALKTINSICSDYNVENYDTNTELLAANLSFDEGGYLSTLIAPVILILILIIIASVLLIYNAFTMSLNERVRYLGMLASVGATKRQKRASIYFEGFILGIIGIPVGTLAGIAGIAVTLYFLSDKIISTGMIAGIENSNLKISVDVPLWAIIMIVIFSVLTIWISTLIPAKKASKITPIDAIKQTDSIKVKKQKYSCPKIVSKIFGFEGEISYKSLKRNSRKTNMITASIALSLILFLCTNYFCTMLMDSNQYSSMIPYQVTVYFSYNDSEKVREVIESVKSVDDVFAATNFTNIVGGDKESANKDYTDITNDSSVLTVQNQKLFDSKKVISINIIDDGRFNQLCLENGLNREQFYSSDNVKCLLLNNMTHSDSVSKVFTSSIIGKSFTAHDPSYGDFKATVGGLIDYDKNSDMCSLNPKGSISMFIPLSVYVETINNLPVKEAELTIVYGVKTKTHEQTEDDIKNALTAAGFDMNDNIFDLDNQQQILNTIIYVLQVFVYGFIALMTLITITNILNTVSTGVILRRKEFAMLRSVGMTPKGFRKMIVMESVFYGLKALVYGLPISLIINFAINKMFGSSYVPFSIDFKAYIGACLAVFIVTGISMIYSVQKIRKDSIIETLKEEIN